MKTYKSFFYDICVTVVILLGSCATVMSAAGTGTEIGGMTSVTQEQPAAVQAVLYAYNTEWGVMELLIQGSEVTGTYPYDNGKIEGVLAQTSMSGRWYQTSSSGRILFNFTSDFGEFTGLYSYGDDEPAYGWNGKLISSTPVQDSEKKTAEPVQVIRMSRLYASDFGEITFNLEGDQVTGSYEYQAGKIEGVLTGLELNGWWYQSNGSGRIRFVFSPDFSTFRGTWSYGSEEPTGAWNGYAL